ncbi:MAG: YcbK family protein [Hyphomicrobiales bacterium]
MRVIRTMVFGVSIGIAVSVMPAAARPPGDVPYWPKAEPAAYAYTSFKHVQTRPLLTLARIVEGDIPPAMRGGGKGLNWRLVSLLSAVERHFGKPVTVTSGCRSFRTNRRAGGARRSFHLRCMAADIRVAGVSEAQVLRYVRKLPGRGGVGTYCRNSVVHLDIGPHREWHQRCGSRHKMFAKKKKIVNWRRA